MALAETAAVEFEVQRCCINTCINTCIHSAYMHTQCMHAYIDAYIDAHTVHTCIHRCIRSAYTHICRHRAQGIFSSISTKIRTSTTYGSAHVSGRARAYLYIYAHAGEVCAAMETLYISLSALAASGGATWPAIDIHVQQAGVVILNE
eukprot:GHVU01008885.1.p1 GENE.GHVU01008885.1~~GHVU01008885.1.p1  ORF type:complete len:148 (-),score=2.66 GHVU01008885.1:342-785(-)